jgi:hypothetical protein
MEMQAEIIRTEICEIHKHCYQKQSMVVRTKTGERFYYILTEHGFDRGIAHRSLALLELVKQHKLMELIVSARISKSGYLILEDLRGNELHLTGCTSGQSGAGPYSTREVLKALGLVNRAASW